MKKKNPLTVTIGRLGYLMTESASGFEHQDLLGTWHVLEGSDRYILCEDRGRYIRFIEFVKDLADHTAVYKGREWKRHPRDNNYYALAGHTKYHGMRMAASFAQALKNILNKPNPEPVDA